MAEKKEQATQENKEVILKISREPFVSKKGTKGFSYFLEGKARGKEFKAKVAPPDKGGYEVLDIVFNGNMDCDLRVEHGEMPNEKSGETIKYDTYIVFSKDADTGCVYVCKVKPEAYSDKVKLGLILQLLNVKS